MRVTVLDGKGVAAGASWGNAGWLTPSISTPLPEPAVLRYGLRAVFDRSSAVYVPPSIDPRLLRFLSGFARHCTMRHWARAMRALIPLNRLALESFDLLARGGVRGETREAQPLLACFATARERDAMVAELEHIRSAGQDVAFDVITGDEARMIEPCLSGSIGAAVQVHRQRFIDPPAYVSALARSVQGRGGALRLGVTVTHAAGTGPAARVAASDGSSREYDAVLLATGAWLGGLARRLGVRTVVQAGRGYSFSIPVGRLPAGPLYFPAARVACTPLGGRLRVAGTMEFRAPDAPLDPRRTQAIADAVRPLLRDADLDDRRDQWVGPRPCTPDGLPLIGATRSPRVFVASGHGMFGITLGPVTGRLLAAQIATGTPVAEFKPFDPLR